MINDSIVQYINTFSVNALTLIKSYSPKKDIYEEEYIKLNANFVYLFSIFERFVGDIIKISITKNNQIKENYINIFNSFAKKKLSEDNKERNWTIFFNQPQVMIDNYQIIEKEKGQMVLAKLLFNMDYNDRVLNKIYKRYCEIRERRNLLIHRGESPDDIFYDTLKNKYKVNRKLIEEIYRTTGLYRKSQVWDSSENKIIYDANRFSNPTNISPTPIYLIYSTSILHSFALILISHCWDFEETEDSPLRSMHDLLYFFYDNDISSDSILNYFHIYNYYKENHPKHILSISEKVNLIIILNTIYLQVNKKNKNIHKKHLNLLIADIKNKNETYEDKFEIHQLMKGYVENDLGLFIKATKKLLKKEPAHAVNIKNWLMYKNLRHTEIFKINFDVDKLIKNLLENKEQS